MTKSPHCPPFGPEAAKVLVVGDFPGADDLYHQRPFSSSAGKELRKIIQDGGFLLSEIRFTYLHKTRPTDDNWRSLQYDKVKGAPSHFIHHFGKSVHPDLVTSISRLTTEIDLQKPDLIITVGTMALWALTRGELTSPDKWRGSQLTQYGYRILPTLSPEVILRNWEYRAEVVRDFRRANDWLLGNAEPRQWNFTVRPSFMATVERLRNLIASASSPLLLSVDLETRAGHLACCGIAWSAQDAISIPFMCVENPEGYWDATQETELILLIRELLTHPNVSVVGQNFSYDAQYISRYWHFTPNVRHDTMLAQGCLWPGMPKGLDYIASLYCRHYVYWKDDGKEWNINIPEEQYWAYNCEDACRTYEIIGTQLETLAALNLSSQYQNLMRRWYPVQQMMRTGVRIDASMRSTMAMELMQAMTDREQWFTDVLGHPLNPRSPKQMQKLFYDDFRCPIQRKRGSQNATLDDKALTKIRGKVPILQPLIQTISDYRSIGVFLSTFVQAPLDVDGRMRCSYNIVGTETFRFNSSENAFGSGTNLQNIPKGNEKPKPGELAMPNIRKLFIPDSGYIIADADLDRADLQVVVWESDDDDLRGKLRAGVDLHTENAKELGVTRALAKSWVHGTNYGGGARTMAATCGITVHQAELMQRRWFQAHPGIKAWHDRTLESLQRTRAVVNPFGFRRFYFGRIEALLPEALAWVPQSTVAHIINEGLYNISMNLPEVQVLLQVHDSLVFQYPQEREAELLPQIRENLLIKVPYRDPLIIPVGLKTSSVSWGAVEDKAWGVA